MLLEDDTNSLLEDEANPELTIEVNDLQSSYDIPQGYSILDNTFGIGTHGVYTNVPFGEPPGPPDPDQQ